MVGTYMVEKAIICKANSFIEASYKLNVTEQRLVLKLVSTIKRTDTEFIRYPFKMSELIEEFGMSRGSGYSEIYEATTSLMKKIIFIKKDGGILKAAFISSAEHTKDGLLYLKFDSELKPYLLQLQNKFTPYLLKNVLGFRSCYSHRFYELLKQYCTFTKRYITLENLRFYLCLDEKVSYADIKRHIIFSQKELQEKSDISFTFEEIKKGKKVESILFRMKINEVSLHFFGNLNSIETTSTDPTSLPNQIWTWIKNWEASTGKQMIIFDRIPSDNNKTMTYLNLLISKLSESKVRALWNDELAKPNPNPINLLTKRFKEELFKAL